MPQLLTTPLLDSSVIEPQRQSQSKSQSHRPNQLKPLIAALYLGIGLTLTPTSYAATLAVTNTNDSGAGSLRATVAAAAAGDVITFPGVSGTITLTSGEIAITQALTITGPGASALTISGNSSSRIFNTSGATTAVTISGLTLTGGAAPGNIGGAIFHRGSGLLTLQNSVVTGNTAQAGGGVGANGFGIVPGSVLITDSTLSGNSATITGGGFWSYRCPLTLERSTLSGNTAARGGGMILLNSTAIVNTIRNSTISGNTSNAAQGGGLSLYSFAGALVTIQNSTVAGNVGGGIYLYGNDAPHLTLASTIVANNTSVSDIFAVGAPLVFNANNSLIQSAPGATITGSGNVLGVDPLLGPLANNGGLTLTRALLPGSPAVDAGSNPASLTTDQRGTGFVRTLGSQTDIGAFESVALVPASITATAGGPQSTPINTAFATALQATVVDGGSTPIAGEVVTFILPSSGASGTFPGGLTTVTANTNASGVATSPLITANGIIGGPYLATATASSGALSASFNLTNTVGMSTSIAATAGSVQSTVVNTAFASALQATVRDAGSNPVPGVTVTFTLPSSGASGSFPGSVTTVTAITNASGIASSPIITANATAGGPYLATATANGGALSAIFSLTNTGGTSFSSVTATATGTATATVSGGGATCQFNPTATAFIAATPGVAFPAGVVALPDGLFQFELDQCDTTPVTISISWPSLALGTASGYLKYGVSPTSPTTALWYASQNTLINGNTVTFTVTDGGLGDDDLTVNGQIVDPSGPVVLSAAAAAEPIPLWSDLARWLITLLIALGVLVKKPKKT